MNLFNYIKSSLDNNSAGASGKKLTSLVITIAYLYSHRYVDHENLVMVLTVDAGLICGLFGINVVDKMKNNNPTE